MKITDIEVMELWVPGWDARDFDGSYDDCVVRVMTDSGFTGLGVSLDMGAVEEYRRR